MDAKPKFTHGEPAWCIFPTGDVLEVSISGLNADSCSFVVKEQKALSGRTVSGDGTASYEFLVKHNDTDEVLRRLNENIEELENKSVTRGSSFTSFAARSQLNS